MVCSFGSKNLQSIAYVSTDASNFYLHSAKAPTPDGTVGVIHMLENPGSSSNFNGECPATLDPGGISKAA